MKRACQKKQEISHSSLSKLENSILIFLNTPFRPLVVLHQSFSFNRKPDKISAHGVFNALTVLNFNFSVLLNL